MKQLTAFLLLFTLLVYTGGSYIVYQLRQLEIKQEMKAYISSNPDDGLAAHFSFSISNKDITDPLFSWEEQGKEFSYQDKMYDVVTMSKEGNKLMITCLQDDHEEELVKAYNDFQKKHPAGASKVLELVKFFSGFIAAPGTSVVNNYPSHHRIQFCTYLFSIPTTSSEIITPPPRLIV